MTNAALARGSDTLEWDEPLLVVDRLVVEFAARRAQLGRAGTIHAVSGVSFRVGKRETFALVGETGSGKTTIGRAILGRVPVTGGTIRFRGEDITHFGPRDWRRKMAIHIQTIYQNAPDSLNQRMRVYDIVAEGIRVHRLAASLSDEHKQVSELLEVVGMGEEVIDRYTHALSGGQLQRVAVARALAVRPELIVADEPTSALDVSSQAQVVNLLQDIQARVGVSYIFISHNLSVVRHIADRVGITYAGKLVEVGETSQVFKDPRHPYTRALLSAVPEIHSGLRRRPAPVRGEIPDPMAPSGGCRFAERCPVAEERCVAEEPPLEGSDVHSTACWVANRL